MVKHSKEKLQNLQLQLQYVDILLRRFAQDRSLIGLSWNRRFLTAPKNLQIIKYIYDLVSKHLRQYLIV